MRVTVLLNAASGSGTAPDAARQIEQLLRDAGHEPGIELARSGDQLRALARAAAKDRPDAVLAGGGDGTINTVAAALVDTAIPLGVLPLGTLNHFAKDLGLPLSLADAVGVALAGHVTAVDVGEVNGHVFLNYSSIGV